MDNPMEPSPHERPAESPPPVTGHGPDPAEVSTDSPAETTSDNQPPSLRDEAPRTFTPPTAEEFVSSYIASFESDGDLPLEDFDHDFDDTFFDADVEATFQADLEDFFKSLDQQIVDPFSEEAPATGTTPQASAKQVVGDVFGSFELPESASRILDEPISDPQASPGEDDDDSSQNAN